MVTRGSACDFEPNDLDAADHPINLRTMCEGHLRRSFPGASRKDHGRDHARSLSKRRSPSTCQVAWWAIQACPSTAPLRPCSSRGRTPRSQGLRPYAPVGCGGGSRIWRAARDANGRVAQSQGCRPRRSSSTRKRIRSSSFMSRSWTVARPSAVTPSMVPSEPTEKCSRHACCLG
jgi:hypothetical protein